MSEGTSNRRIYRDIAEKISEKILAGEYAAGGRLPAERELAERFDVSRSSIREALIALEISGLVDVKLGSGVYVRDLAQRHRSTKSRAKPTPRTGQAQAAPASAASVPASPHQRCKAQQPSLAALPNAWQQRTQEAQHQAADITPFELLEARLLVEPECAAAAAQNMTAAQIDELKRLHVQMLKTGAWGEEDYIFHSIISQNCGNAALALTCEHLWFLTLNCTLYQRLNQYIVTADVWSQNLAEHERIVTALVSRDTIRARYAMQQHLIGIMARLREAHLD